MSDTSQPYDCSALERDLHLVIGGDLDPSDLARAQEHLSDCAACELLAGRASEMRQLYFEAASRATSEPVDLWEGIQDALRSEGSFAGAGAAGHSGDLALSNPTDSDPSQAASPAPRKPTTMEFAALAEMVPAREFLDSGPPGSTPASSRSFWRGPENRAFLGVLAGAAAATVLILLRPDPVDPVLPVSDPSVSGQLASSALAESADSASGRVVLPEARTGVLNDPAAGGLHAISPYSQSERLALQDALYNLRPGFALNSGAPQGAERLASFQSSGVELR